LNEERIKAAKRAAKNKQTQDIIEQIKRD